MSRHPYSIDIELDYSLNIVFFKYKRAVRFQNNARKRTDNQNIIAENSFFQKELRLFC